MTKAKTTDIRLAEANAKHTKAKQALDGTEIAEKRYRKANRALWDARQAWRREQKTGTRTGDAVVKAKALSVKTRGNN